MGVSRQEIAQARTLQQLQQLERKYNYKYGWAVKIQIARGKKNDGVHASRAAGKEVVRQTQDKAPQDERAGAARLAGQNVLPTQYSFLDRV